MKLFKIFTILILIIAISYAGEALAAKPNPFDSRTLQPMPIPDIRPNISESVNYNPEQLKKNFSPQNPIGQNTAVQGTAEPSIGRSSGFKFSPVVLIWIVIITLIAGLSILAIPLLKSKR
ncbi:MAG TPA: hypothetical protein VJI33_00880 [Candidatus Paceibacterota bacterium]